VSLGLSDKSEQELAGNIWFVRVWYYDVLSRGNSESGGLLTVFLEFAAERGSSVQK